MREPGKRSIGRTAIQCFACGLLVALFVAGCAPTAHPVFVDVDGVLSRENVPTPKPISVPSPPRAMPPLTVVQPGRPEATLRDPSTSSEGDVRRAIALQQERDYERLVRRLTEFYEADAQRFEQEKLREQSEKTSQAYQTALAKIRQIFEVYAKRRAPVLADLTIISGFPDPNPSGTPPRQPLNKVRQHYFDQAKTLRERLHAIDADYDAQADQVVLGVGVDVAQAIMAINEQVRRYRLANEIRAEKEASQQVRQTSRALGLRLAEPLRIELSSVPSTTTTIHGGPAPIPAPVVTSTGVLSTPTDRRLLIEHEMRIWMGQNRFVLAGKGPRVPDKTAEFETWRNARTVGR